MNDTTDFVFVDRLNRPYRVKHWGDAPWLFYWHASKQWVSLKAISPMAAATLRGLALPPEQATLYETEKG